MGRPAAGQQLFDEVETLQGDRYRFDALISVLHVGFERGGVVTRLERRDERFVGDIPGDWRREQSAERSYGTRCGKNVRDHERRGHSMHREKISQIRPRKLFVADHPGLYPRGQCGFKVNE